MSERTVCRYLTQQRQTGGLAPGLSAGMTPTIDPDQAVAAYHDIRLEDHCELRGETQASGSALRRYRRSMPAPGSLSTATQRTSE